MTRTRALLTTAALVIGGFTFASLAAEPASPAPSDTPPVAAPAADNAEPAAPAIDPLVEKGKYLAAAGDCVSCHTREGGEPFSGGRAFATPLGRFFSTNITPDQETGIGTWTEADLIRAMHEGKAKDGRQLNPAFPYSAFTKVTDEDVKAIYAYLRTLNPVKYTAPENDFLFNQRWGFMFWNAVFFKAERFKPDSSKSEQWNRGAYLVEGLGHCGSCHTPRNIFLAEQLDQSFAGGNILDEVHEGKIRRWSAPNLSPAKGGLATWSANDIVKYLKTGFTVSRAGTFGPMNDVIVNSMSKMTDEDLQAIATYLKELPPREVKGSVPEDQAKAGQPLYKEKCSKCHMDSGRGGMFNGPPLAGSAIAQSEDPSSFINVVLYGPNLPAGVKTGAWETMKPFADSMSDEEIATVMNYVRGSWGNVGRPVTAAEIAKQR
jgi:alcohol dehydrogenase (quinone), cytochrome c subunit